MSRFILVASVSGQPPGWASQKFPGGLTIADSAENAQSSRGNSQFGYFDVVWPALVAAPTVARLRG
jgi:hypothetical protein